MKKILKWTGIILGALLLLVAFLVGSLVIAANSQLAKTYTIEPQLLEIPSDSSSLAKGAHWADAQCKICHGENLSGQITTDDPGFGRIFSSNLTPGKGGIGNSYSDRDWIRAIRHGINLDGRGLIAMPSADYNHLSASDVGSIIAYLKTIPPVDNQTAGVELGILGKVLLVAGAIDGIISAEVIDHSRPAPSSPDAGMAIQFGEYLVNASGCRTCHGPTLNGMQPPMPGAPFAPDLTKGGNLVNWSASQFVTCIRSGNTPEGKKLNEKFMPWGSMGRMTDDELEAIFAYATSL